MIARQAFALLEEFEQKLVDHLVAALLLHTDETSINIDGKLHCHSNARWTLFYTHTRRGTEAMNEKGVLPRFKGVFCHDHWKPYYQYIDCEHALCNAHHLRELERAHAQDGQQWAKHYTERYRNLLSQTEIECPPPDEKKNPKQRGRTKRGKARNLLERFQLYEQDVCGSWSILSCLSPTIRGRTTCA
ncbi:MAG: transposase [Nitrosomonas sp.]|nr:transposase [Nitrosomonas sp.]MCP5251854.1 transposase [Burkholderiales bacterium]